MTDPSKKAQWQLILEFMLRGGRITQLLALQEFSCMRLGARIWDIEANTDLKVQRQTVNGVNKNGDPVKYHEYWIDIPSGPKCDQDGQYQLAL